jgi:hypothetical protein
MESISMATAPSTSHAAGSNSPSPKKAGDLTASDALKRIFANIPKEALDSEILFERGRAHFTVGALREVFADEDVGKYNPHTGEYDKDVDPPKDVVAGTQSLR